MNVHKDLSPKVSIIMPTYNGERYIVEAIESVLQQTFQDFELIVVDDGSTDGTASIVRNFQERDGRIKYFYKQNGGVATASNYAIERAGGEYIAICDHDDISLPHRLEMEVSVLEENKDVSLVYSSILVFNEADLDGKIFRIPDKGFCTLEGQFKKMLKKGCYVDNPSVVFRKKVWEDNKYDETLPFGNLWHDFLFFLEACQHYTFYGIQEPLVKYRRGHNSLSDDRLRNFEADKNVFGRIYKNKKEIFGISYAHALSFMYLHHARLALYSNTLPNNISICFSLLSKSFLARPANAYIYKNLFGLILPLVLRKLGGSLLHNQNMSKH